METGWPVFVEVVVPGDDLSTHVADERSTRAGDLVTAVCLVELAAAAWTDVQHRLSDTLLHEGPPRHLALLLHLVTV